MKIFNTTERSGRARLDHHDGIEAYFDAHFQNQAIELSVLKKEFENYISELNSEELLDDFDVQDLIEFYQGPYLVELEKMELKRTAKAEFPSKALKRI